MILKGISVGDRLPPLEKDLSRPQLFRYSAITWNAHRIHYDHEYATEVEGYPDVLVQSHMHGAVIQELIMNWIGDDGKLVGLSWRNVAPATPDLALSVHAEAINVDTDALSITFETWTESNGRKTAEGTATVNFSSNLDTES